MSKNNLMTYLLQSPPYLLGFFAILGFGWSAGHFKENVWHMVSLSSRPDQEICTSTNATGAPSSTVHSRNRHDDHDPQRWRSLHWRLLPAHRYGLGLEPARLVGDQSGPCSAP